MQLFARARFGLSKRLSLLLVFLLLLTPFAGGAYGATFGDLLYSRSILIGNTAELANGIYWSNAVSDKITENYISYQPGSQVLPVIAYGNDIYGAASFRAATQIAESEFGNGRVMAGINGDFFTMATGVPQGVTIKAHTLYTSGFTPAIGFFDNGRAIMGNLSMNIKLASPALPQPIGYLGLNKEMTTQCGLIIYTDEYSSDDTNRATIPTYNVLVDVATSDMRINGSLTGTVRSGSAATKSSAVPAGTVLLSMAEKTPYTTTLGQLKALKAGDSISISFTADSAWNDVAYAIGTGDRLVSAGQNIAPMKNSLQTARHPRTAVGIKADGSIIFYTVDGRQPGYSSGVNLRELAGRMLELGCVDAVNLDGGGSTAEHGIYPGDNFLSVINKPSQGSLRSCANYIMLMNPLPATGAAAQLHLYPYNVRLLTGATQTFQIKATDSNYYPAPAPAVADVTFSANGNVGTVDASGRLTAGTDAAVGDVTADCGGLTGRAVVEVVAQPDSISIVRQADAKAVTQLTLKPGETIDLKVLATYKRMPLIAQDTSFSWSVTDNIGTVDAEGVFKASNSQIGTGAVIVGIGSLTAKIPVTVDPVLNTTGWLIDDFEKDQTIFTAGGTGIVAGSLKDLSKVRYGWKSAQLNYNKGAIAGDLLIPAPVDFYLPTTNLNFWVYGDGSGNTLGVNVVGQAPAAPVDVSDPNAPAISEPSVVPIPLAGPEPSVKLDFTGWKQVSLALPAGATGMSGFFIRQSGSKTSGMIYLDQIIGSVGAYLDTMAPNVTLSLAGTNLSGTISDAADTTLGQTQIQTTYDGSAVAFNFSPAVLTAALPAADGKPHRIAVEATDISGNKTRTTVKVPAGAGMAQPFVDMKKHWGGESAAYLYYQKISNGVKTADGLKYLPDKNLTRAEFAVLMTNWNGLDASKYADVKLPFADTAQIPAWAVGAVKAMYKTGTIQGVAASGKLYFKPTASITREEVMTIIGRTLPRGYAENNLAAFADRGQVSTWALPYVRPLVQMKAISGYDGKLWPKNPVTRAQVASIIFQMN